MYLTFIVSKCILHFISAKTNLFTTSSLVVVYFVYTAGLQEKDYRIPTIKQFSIFQFSHHLARWH